VDPLSYEELDVFCLLFELEAFLLKKPFPPFAVLDSYCCAVCYVFYDCEGLEF